MRENRPPRGGEGRGGWGGVRGKKIFSSSSFPESARMPTILISASQGRSLWSLLVDIPTEQEKGNVERSEFKEREGEPAILTQGRVCSVSSKSFACTVVQLGSLPSPEKRTMSDRHALPGNLQSRCQQTVLWVSVYGTWVGESDKDPEGLCSNPYSTMQLTG